jgi:PAS domain-containing protein
MEDAAFNDLPEDSRRLLEKVFAGLHDVLFVVDHESARIIRCNPAALKIFGSSREEIIRASALITCADDAIVNHGVPDSRAAFLQKPFTIDSSTSKVAGMIHAEQKAAAGYAP